MNKFKRLITVVIILSVADQTHLFPLIHIATPGNINIVFSEVNEITLAEEAAKEATTLYKKVPNEVFTYLNVIADKYNGEHIEKYGDLVIYKKQGILIVGRSAAGKSHLAHALIKVGARFGGSNLISLLRIGTILIGGISYHFSEKPLSYGFFHKDMKQTIKPTKLFVPITTAVALNPVRNTFNAQVIKTDLRLNELCTKYSAGDATFNQPVKINQTFVVDVPRGISDRKMRSVAKKIIARVNKTIIHEHNNKGIKEWFLRKIIYFFIHSAA